MCELHAKCVILGKSVLDFEMLNQGVVVTSCEALRP